MDSVCEREIGRIVCVCEIGSVCEREIGGVCVCVVVCVCVSERECV